MAFHAFTVLNGGVNHWHYEFGLPVAAKAEGWDRHVKQLFIVRLVRLVALQAHTFIGWPVPVPLGELLLVMALDA